MKVDLDNVRLAFPVLFEAEAFNGKGTPAFSAVFIFPPDHPARKLIEDAIKTIANAKWGAKAAEMLKVLKAKDALCLRNGDTKNYAGFEGNYYVSARSKIRPPVIDRFKNPLTAEDGVLYAGCYVNGKIEVWLQKDGGRFNASLRGVQYVRDSDAFTRSGVASIDDFNSLEEGADADSLV